MIQQYLTLLLTLFVGSITAQNNLIVLTEKGDLFTLFVNDEKINDSTQSVVNGKKIYEDTCRVKMEFADRNIPAYSGSVFLTVSGKAVTKREFTYSLVQEKGKRELKFISVNFIHSDTSSKPLPPEKKIEKIFIDKKKRDADADKLNDKYPPPANCATIISDSALAAGIVELKGEHIELNRLKDAKWFVSTNCINTQQLIKVMDTFGQQTSKVKIAEFAFAYISDHRNFLETTEAVKFMTEKEELKAFFNKHIEK